MTDTEIVVVENNSSMETAAVILKVCFVKDIYKAFKKPFKTGDLQSVVSQMLLCQLYAIP